MPSEDYHKAMRQGLKEVKAAQALGEISENIVRR